MSHFSDEGLQRGYVLDLAARVQPYVDADIDREWSRYVTPAKVTVVFRDGHTLENRTDYPKGHPNKMTEAELAANTADCATFAAKPLPADTAARLITTIGRLEQMVDIAELVSTIV